MGLVRYFTPENPLAKAIAVPGGKLVSEAVDDARIELLEISDECLAEVDTLLARVYQLSGSVPAGAELTELYRTVREVAGLAGMCDLEDMGAAALSFCALLDHAQDGGQLTQEHIDVHVNVLKILRRSGDFTEAQRAVVLKNLDAMVEKLAKKDAAASE
jgi:hypothetical protein